MAFSSATDQRHPVTPPLDDKWSNNTRGCTSGWHHDVTPCRRRRKSNEHRSRFAAARGVGHFARLIGFSGPLENPPACTRTNLIFFRWLAVTMLSDPGAKPSGTFLFLVCLFLERFCSRKFNVFWRETESVTIWIGINSSTLWLFSALSRFSCDRLLLALSPCPAITGWVQGKIRMDPDKSLCKSVWECVCVCVHASSTSHSFHHGNRRWLN